MKLPEEIKSDDVCHPCEFSKMAKLMFDSNPITEWEEIAKLGEDYIHVSIAYMEMMMIKLCL